LTSGRVQSNPLFSEDYIFQRWNELVTLFEVFRETYREQAKPEYDFGIDPVCLYQITTSYFHDVARYKLLHFGLDAAHHRIDDCKRSAYITYWLTRLRPIYIIRPARFGGIGKGGLDFTQDSSLLVNIDFALCVAFSYLEFGFSDQVNFELQYLFSYRLYDPNTLIVMFDILKMARLCETAHRCTIVTI